MIIERALKFFSGNERTSVISYPERVTYAGNLVLDLLKEVAAEGCFDNDNSQSERRRNGVDKGLPFPLSTLMAMAYRDLTEDDGVIMYDARRYDPLVNFCLYGLGERDGVNVPMVTINATNHQFIEATEARQFQVNYSAVCNQVILAFTQAQIYAHGHQGQLPHRGFKALLVS